MTPDPLFDAERWLAEGRGVALATVLSTWGSAPRQPGSQMAIRDDGAFTGSVSAGCVEGAVVEAALAALADGTLKRLHYGVEDATAWAAGLTCGGRIEILVEPLVGTAARTSVAAVNASRRRKVPVVCGTDLVTGDCRVIDPQDDDGPLTAEARTAARTDRSREVLCEGVVWFLAVANPPVGLVLVGAVHIAQALARIAVPLGYAVRIIDPRQGFASEEHFPGLSLSHDYPDEALARSPLTSRSAIVALAHDPKIDDPALIAALQSPAFYIGALGSQKTQSARRERLKAAGFGDLARLHGPVGLAIGSQMPEEIAVSIVAEIIATLHGA
jgi:xanthine dehydrogenase accessory factor